MERVKDILKDATNSHLRNMIAEEFTMNVWCDFASTYCNDLRPANECFKEWALSQLDENFKVSELKENGWI